MARISLVSLLLMFTVSKAFTTSNKPSFTRAATQPLRMIGSILDLLGGPDKSQLISPDNALPGRSTEMPNIKGSRHYVLGNKLDEVPEGHEVAVFGNGCFWGSEKGIWRLPKGIHSTAVGYCAGFTPNPTYEGTFLLAFRICVKQESNLPWAHDGATYINGLMN